MLLGLSILLVACGGSSDTSDSSPTTPLAPTGSAVTDGPVDRPTEQPIGGRLDIDLRCVVPDAGDTGLIAFTKHLEWPELWVIAGDGSGERRLAPLAGKPSWSPDGTRIAVEDTEFGIQVLDLVACSSSRLIDDPDGMTGWPAWSPNETEVAFAARGEGWSGLRIADLDGQVVAAVADGETWEEAPSSPRDPAWSPDGLRLAFVGESGDESRLAVVDRANTELIVLASTSDGYVSSPSWSPDGTEIAFAMHGEISIVGHDGAGLEQLTDTAAMGVERARTPAWTADGRVLFSAGSGQGDFGALYNLFIVDRDGSNLTELTADVLGTSGLSIDNHSPAAFDGVPVGVESGPDGDPDGRVEIGTINFDAAGDDNQNLNDEWLEIHNAGPAISLGGWRIHDETMDLHVYVFPSWVWLEPGATVRLHTGEGVDSAADLYWGHAVPPSGTTKATWSSWSTPRDNSSTGSPTPDDLRGPAGPRRSRGRAGPDSRPPYMPRHQRGHDGGCRSTNRGNQVQRGGIQRQDELEAQSHGADDPRHDLTGPLNLLILSSVSPHCILLSVGHLVIRGVIEDCVSTKWTPDFSSQVGSGTVLFSGRYQDQLQGRQP